MEKQAEKTIDVSPEELLAAFAPLWSDITQGETFPQKRPLLAHYTSITSLENVMRSNEVWFSNPLYMNDISELKFGMLEGAKAFRESEKIRRACSSRDDYAKLRRAFDQMFETYDQEHVFDTYIFSMSEHTPDNHDGLLSMWRGYGGNGSGAAIVIDSQMFEHIQGTVPLIISKVLYAPTSTRLSWLVEKMNEFAALLEKTKVPSEMFYVPVHQLFERIKMFALFTKHDGFSEENEWRIAFLKERDVKNKFSDMFGYTVGKRGIEPKLKFKIAPIDGYTSQDLSLEKIVSQVILGPMVASPLAVNSVKRMLRSVGKSALADRVSASTTPFRPD